MPLIPAMLGAVLAAAAAGDGQALFVMTREIDWLLSARCACELLGSLWIVSGPAPRLARTVLMVIFAEILLYDLVNALTTSLNLREFAQITPGALWTLASDLTIVLALGFWCPGHRRPQSVRQVERLIAMGLGLAALGVALDRTEVFRSPMVATIAPPGPQKSAGLNYLIYLPPNYDRSAGPWPLIVALHGIGGVGHDLALVQSKGLPRYAEERGDLPFLIVAPQSTIQAWDISALNSLLDDVLARYRADASRTYLTGLSLGGHGAWTWAMARPDRFAAIAPICGWGDTSQVGRLRKTPAWAFHGTDDGIVPPDCSRVMVAALQATGGEARLTLYPGGGHDAWTATYRNPRLYEWLLEHRREPIP